jgi:hypothetical protein
MYRSRPPELPPQLMRTVSIRQHALLTLARVVASYIGTNLRRASRGRATPRSDRRLIFSSFDVVHSSGLTHGRGDPLLPPTFFYRWWCPPPPTPTPLIWPPSTPPCPSSVLRHRRVGPPLRQAGTRVACLCVTRRTKGFRIGKVFRRM